MNMQLYPVPASSLALAAVAKKSDTPRATDWHSAERQVTHREKNEPKTKEILSKSLYMMWNIPWQSREGTDWLTALLGAQRSTAIHAMLAIAMAANNAFITDMYPAWMHYYYSISYFTSEAYLSCFWDFALIFHLFMSRLSAPWPASPFDGRAWRSMTRQSKSFSQKSETALILMMVPPCTSTAGTEKIDNFSLKLHSI